MFKMFKKKNAFTSYVIPHRVTQSILNNMLTGPPNHYYITYKRFPWGNQIFRMDR